MDGTRTFLTSRPDRPRHKAKKAPSESGGAFGFGDSLDYQTRERRISPVGVGFFVVRLNSASMGKRYRSIPELAREASEGGRAL